MVSGSDQTWMNDGRSGIFFLTPSFLIPVLPHSGKLQIYPAGTRLSHRQLPVPSCLFSLNQWWLCGAGAIRHFSAFAPLRFGDQDCSTELHFS